MTDQDEGNSSLPPTTPPAERETGEVLRQIAYFLWDQQGEPDPFFRMGDRGHYWRDKCIEAGARLLTIVNGAAISAEPSNASPNLVNAERSEGRSEPNPTAAKGEQG